MDGEKVKVSRRHTKNHIKHSPICIWYIQWRSLSGRQATVAAQKTKKMRKCSIWQRWHAKTPQGLLFTAALSPLFLSFHIQKSLFRRFVEREIFHTATAKASGSQKSKDKRCRCRGCLSCQRENLVANDAETKYCCRARRIGSSSSSQRRTMSFVYGKLAVTRREKEGWKKGKREIWKIASNERKFKAFYEASTRYIYTIYTAAAVERSEKLNKLVVEIWWWRELSLNENWIFTAEWSESHCCDDNVDIVFIGCGNFFLFFLSFFLIDAAVRRRFCCCRLAEEKKSAGVEWDAGGRMMWFDKSTSLACVESVYMRAYTRERKTWKRKWNSQHNDIQFDFNLFLPPSSLSAPPPPTWFRRTHLNNPISWHTIKMFWSLLALVAFPVAWKCGNG